jgi:hypothetical protein
MRNAARALHLNKESGADCWIGSKKGANGFDGDRFVQAMVDGLIDFAHTALPKQPHDLEAAGQRLTHRKLRIWRDSGRLNQFDRLG